VPSWQPNWDDVRFDHGGAVEAIEALTAAYRRLEDQRETRAALAVMATRQWRGPAREIWVEIVAQLVVEQTLLALELRDDARRIETAAIWARREQANREVEREIWFRESALEADLVTAVSPRSGSR